MGYEKVDFSKTGNKELAEKYKECQAQAKAIADSCKEAEDSLYRQIQLLNAQMTAVRNKSYEQRKDLRQQYTDAIEHDNLTKQQVDYNKRLEKIKPVFGEQDYFGVLEEGYTQYIRIAVDMGATTIALLDTHSIDVYDIARKKQLYHCYLSERRNPKKELKKLRQFFGTDVSKLIKQAKTALFKRFKEYKETVLTCEGEFKLSILTECGDGGFNAYVYNFYIETTYETGELIPQFSRRANKYYKSKKRAVKWLGVN